MKSVHLGLNLTWGSKKENQWNVLIHLLTIHMFLPYPASWLPAYMQTLAWHMTQPLLPHLSCRSICASLFLLRGFSSSVFPILSATSRPKLQTPLLFSTHFTFSLTLISSHICLPMHMIFRYRLVFPNSHAETTKQTKMGCVHEGNSQMVAWTFDISKSCTHF